MATEAMAALQAGVPVAGLCLYPVVDHIGWDDGRVCPSGLLGHVPGPHGRSVCQPLADELLRLRRDLAGHSAALELAPDMTAATEALPG